MLFPPPLHYPLFNLLPLTHHPSSTLALPSFTPLRSLYHRCAKQALHLGSLRLQPNSRSSPPCLAYSTINFWPRPLIKEAFPFSTSLPSLQPPPPNPHSVLLPSLPSVHNSEIPVPSLQIIVLLYLALEVSQSLKIRNHEFKTH